MLTQLDRHLLSRYLSPDQLITLEMLVWLLQVHKSMKIERLAAYFPLPIKYESRRRRIPRFLKLNVLSVSLLWLPPIAKILERKFSTRERLYLVLDRTQWKEKNLFVVGVIMGKRALPIYWRFFEKKGASNLAEQQAMLRPVLKLLKDYQIVILGDREFHSVELAQWLHEKKVYFVLRQKKSTKIETTRQGFQSLKELSIRPGEGFFLPQIKVTQAHQITGLSMGIYWRGKDRGMGELEPWYLLTNFANLAEAVKAYKKRVGKENI